MNFLAVPFNVVNLNNRMYTKDSFKDCDFSKVKKITAGYGKENFHEEVDLDSVIGIVNKIDVTDNGVYIDYQWINSPTYKSLHTILEDRLNYRIRPFSIGNITHDEHGVGIVTEAQLLSFAVISADNDGFDTNSNTQS